MDTDIDSPDNRMYRPSQREARSRQQSDTCSHQDSSRLLSQSQIDTLTETLTSVYSLTSVPPDLAQTCRWALGRCVAALLGAVVVVGTAAAI